jgi:alanyl-tRNA synthetase
MKSTDVRKKYLEFFKKRGHAEIPSAKLVPENDPTTLFNSAGMQPLIQYILGAPHPLGKRLVNSQKSFRSQDIDEVGDNRHTTFFEMLGNWSLGDPDAADGIGAGYFKKEQLPWIFEFLTKELGLDPKRLYVSVFQGEGSVPKDTESINIWKEVFSGVGIDAKVGERIFVYPAHKNWWSRSGEPEKMPQGEPGGPDSEVFYDFGEQLGLHEKSPYKNEKCHPNCDCGRFLEIANSVFMQYQKQKDGTLKELAQKNVDFGGGLERIVAATENTPDIFTTDMFTSIIRIIEVTAKKTYGKDVQETRAMRIIADHMRAAVMMMTDGVFPSNKTQGYVLRRLIRRSLLYGRKLGLTGDLTYISRVVEPIASVYESAYPEVKKQQNQTQTILTEEAIRFSKTLDRGIREIERVSALDGKIAFTLYETYGFPWEMTVEIATEKGQQVDRGQFEEEFKKHQQLSRTAAAGMFKGGLADHSEQTTKLHTAHHLLLASLQKIVDPTIKQRGSNITAERLRMDFNFSRKVTPEELKKVEDLVNETIKKDLPVSRVEMPREEAQKIGAEMEFGTKYPDRVSVYFVGTKPDYFSKEFCGGPHIECTGVIGKLKILKEESAGAGIRRIYATIQ